MAPYMNPPWGYYDPMWNASPTPHRTRFGGFGGFDDDDRSWRRARSVADDDKEKRELERRLQQAEIERKELEYKQQLERQQLAHEQALATMREEIRRLSEMRNKTEDDEVRRLREERENAMRELMQQQLLAIRQQHEQAMLQLRAEIARLVETPKGESEEIRRLREEQERQAREFERQRLEQERRLEMERLERERERERFEQQRRDEMLQRELKEAREAAERRIEQIQQATLGRQDPIVEVMKENARTSAENMRELARMQAEATNRMAQFMVPPTQLAQIMKDSSASTDGVVRGIIQSVGEIGNLYKSAAETIMNMSGGGSDPPAARLIQEGIGRASEVAERFLAVKRDQVISEAKIKQAEAQRDQTRIQAEAALRAQALAAGRQGLAGWQPPPPVAPMSTESSATASSSPAAPAAAAPAAAAPAAAAPAAAAPAAASASSPTATASSPEASATRNGRNGRNGKATKSAAPSDEELFGVALESVLHLRQGVADGKLTPDSAVDAILKGVDYIVANQIVVPAFVLFQQERWADFIDVMLPNAPAEFKAECVRILTEEVEQVDPEEGDEDLDEGLDEGSRV
jgi:hypothetical protein